MVHAATLVRGPRRPNTWAKELASSRQSQRSRSELRRSALAESKTCLALHPLLASQVSTYAKGGGKQPVGNSAFRTPLRSTSLASR